MAGQTDTSGSSSPSGPASLREQKKAGTRQAVLDAITLIELVHGGVVDPELFTFANIARVAGVSERTVYRLFPTRDALDEAITREQSRKAGDLDPTDLDAWAPAIRAEMRHWSERAGGERVSARERTYDEFPAALAARAERDRILLEALEPRFGGEDRLGPRQRRAYTAALRSIISVRTIATSALRWGLTLEEAGEAHAWAFEALLHALDDEPPQPWEIEP